MSDKSGIEWTDATWNPIVGCSLVSPGCTNCYAMKMAARLEAMNMKPDGRGNIGLFHYDGTTKEARGGAVWTGKIAQAPDHILTQPLRWRHPRRIFVNSMGDLFHESIPDEWIDRVFAVMALCPQHTFQVLTKRSARMRAYLSMARAHPVGLAALAQTFHCMAADPHSRVGEGCILQGDVAHLKVWPLPNVWLAVSAEDQRRYEERRDDLRATPAAIHFFSFEPLLGAVNADYLGEWGIVGGESGPHARPMHPDWARSIRDQCAAAGVPFFFKQWGEFGPQGVWAGTETAHTKPGALLGPTRDGFMAVERAGGGLSHGIFMSRVGKRRAGRLLDGAEHNAYPEPRS